MLEAVLGQYAGRPKEGEAVYFPLADAELEHSFIQTNWESLQLPYAGTMHSTIRRALSKNDSLPYSVFIPRTGNGTRIGFYGNDPFLPRTGFGEAVSSGKALRNAVVATCPANHAMMWSIRTIHCGGYFGPKEASTF